MDKEIEIIRDKLSKEELLCQLAEECAELGQAALKLRRTLTKDNPTPVSSREAQEKFYEEKADVLLVLDVLGIGLNSPLTQSIIADKKNRWVSRLEGNDV